MYEFFSRLPAFLCSWFPHDYCTQSNLFKMFLASTRFIKMTLYFHPQLFVSGFGTSLEVQNLEQALEV